LRLPRFLFGFCEAWGFVWLGLCELALAERGSALRVMFFVIGMDDILLHYIDDALLVAEKPAGLLSVPGRLPENQDCLVSRLQALYPDALTVHRLDQVTSGLMVYA